MTIEKTHHAQNPVNVALLSYVAEASQASYAELFAAFADLQSSEVKAHARFSKKMEYLCFTQQLCSRGRGHDRVFSLGPEAGKAGHSRKWHGRHKEFLGSEPNFLGKLVSDPNNSPAAEVPEPLPKFLPDPIACQRATAPAINVMAADYPLYQAPPHPALRPGALDYQRYAARGVRC